ncbi:MAG: DUF309 domain-containing protein [Nitriliruptoraceae bacterium]
MSERQRRNDGAPEQQRPRDRTGRPLAYDTSEPFLAEQHDPVSVEHALQLGRDLWNEHRFFEAHECLEAVWHAAPRHDRDLWQGVIQIAVAQVHRQRGNPAGSIQLYVRAGQHLAEYPPVWRGIEVAKLRRYAQAAVAALCDETDPPEAPVFPDTSGGAWFAYTDTQDAPSDSQTPLSNEPRWLSEGLRRTPQRKPTG